VCLFQVTNIPEALWLRLTAFVKAGGGLAIVPAGDELKNPKAFNDGGRELLPAPLEKLIGQLIGKNTEVNWEPFNQIHPLSLQFAVWKRTAAPDFDSPEWRPFVRRYWKLGPLQPQANDVARYADKDRNVALAD